MVRFVHIADVHLGISQYNLKERFIDFGRAFKDAIDFGLNNNVDFFLIAGDLFEDKSIDPDTLLQAEKILRIPQEKGVPVFVCEGNHDSRYYGKRFSWLEYLSQAGMIRLLCPEVGELVPWDDKEKSGSYFEGFFSGQKVRIYGFGYLGASTRKRLNEFSDKIIRDDAVNIAMLHIGLEGYINRMSGTIEREALSVLNDRVDYLALGHIHKQYKDDDAGWIFNPGSLENWSLDETRYPHGLYLVSIEKNEDGRPEINAEFVDWKSHRRPFYVWRIDVGGAVSPEDVRKRVEEFLAEKGMRNTGREKPALTGVPHPGKGHGATLDSFGIMDKVNQGEKDMGKITEEGDTEGKKHGERDDGAVDGTVEGAVDGADGKNDGGTDGKDDERKRPIVIVRLKGKVDTEMPIDVGAVKEIIHNSVRPIPIYEDVRDESSRDDVPVEGDEQRPKKELELQVIRERLEQGDYSDFAEELAILIYDIKEGFVKKEPPEEFVKELREIAAQIVAKGGESAEEASSMGTDETNGSRTV